MNLDNFKNKRILILGLGKEGLDNFRFLRKLFPKKVLGVGDKNENVKAQISNVKRIRWHLGENYLKALKKYDILIKSPGIPPKVIKPFITKEQRITSQTEIFFENCPGKIIGVTGTKGKSTTASLICQILKACPELSRRVHLVGNIGKPVLSLLFSATPKDVYVYELSSHQLSSLKKSPQIAVFLNIYPDHLDYYKDFKEYLLAKQNITRYQNKEDYFIFNPKDKNVQKTAKISQAKKISINIPKIQEDVDFFDTCRKSQLKGKFNFLNIAAAIEVGKIFKVPKEKIVRAIKNFKSLPHRLELVGDFKGITFYNDSISTIPESTIAAIETLGRNVQTIILGGSDKKVDFKKLAKDILKRKDIKNVILFPTTGEKIWRKILSSVQGKKLPKHFFVDNMRDTVKLAYQHTGKGKICLLSPASPSFGVFRDYKERGNLFKEYLKFFGKKIII